MEDCSRRAMENHSGFSGLGQGFWVFLISEAGKKKNNLGFKVLDHKPNQTHYTVTAITH